MVTLLTNDNHATGRKTVGKVTANLQIRFLAFLAGQSLPEESLRSTLHAYFLLLLSTRQHVLATSLDDIGSDSLSLVGRIFLSYLGSLAYARQIHWR